MMKRCFIIALAISLPATAENLDEIYQQVLQSDPRLLMDSLGVEIGVARKQQAYGALLPQVSINSNWTENKRKADGFQKDSFSGERYTFSIRQPLLDMPKYHGWKRSEDILSQFEFQHKDTQSNVRLDTIERYFQLLNASDELVLVQEDKRATEKRVEQTKALYQKQLVKITEFYEVNARLDMLVSEEIDAMQAVDLAKEGLSELTSNPVDYISPLIESVEFIQRVENVEQWIKSSTVANFSLKALQKAIDAAQRNLDQQTAGHFPIVELQLSKQKSNIGFENSLSPSTTTEVATLNLTIPLYSGGQTSGRVYEASQQLALSHATFDQEYRKVVKELRDRYLSVNAMVRRVEATEKAIQSADKSYQAMNRSFELGIATISEVLDAQQFFLQAKRNYQQAKYDYIIHKTRLFHISGKLDNDIFYKISDWLM